MSNVIVFCEFHDGKLKKGSLELLSAAKSAGSTLSAFLIGPGSKDVAAETGHYGATTTFVCDDGSVDNYNPESFSNLAAQIIKESGAEILLASSSMLSKDMFPRVACKLDTGIASDCTDLMINGSEVTAKKPLYSGKCKATVSFNNSPVKMVLMRPNQLPIGDSDTSGSTEVKEVSAPSAPEKAISKEVKKGASDKMDLTEANIVISGGRGMKEADNFKLLDELAETLGATVGASRAVADAGWVPHSMQVGQTGKTVAPSLYIACGISGAIQHLAGMSSSKVIVAINQDADAPIFTKSNYGIVGDLFEVVPKLNEELKAVLN